MSDPDVVREAAKLRARRWRDRHPGAGAAATRRWRERNPGECARRVREYRANNPEYIEYRRQYDAERYRKNAEAEKDRLRKWKTANPERVRASKKAYWEANPGARNAYRMAYHARKLNAIPKWADMEYIDALYELAKELSFFYGEPLEVDHIVPLQSALVCGLHVQGNLRIVSTADNRRKQNFFTMHQDSLTRASALATLPLG